MKLAPNSSRRMTFVLSIVLAFTLLACTLNTLFPQGNGPTLPAPNGWKSSKDPSGSCQVATPPDWQLGRDFFLEAEKTDPGPFLNKPGQFPPMGLALWGVDKVTQLPAGKRFQMRTSVVHGSVVCSVWQIKETTDFTDAEKSTLEQVGMTLQEVK
jgi:hypothetical protein